MNLPEKMVNVRRATRLLAAYNRRILTILKLADKALSESPSTRLRFQSWYPFHHDALGRATQAPFGRWGWDFLPLSYSWFTWTSDGEQRPGAPESVLVGIAHEVDDGYDAESRLGEPDPQHFAEARDSGSRLHLWVVKLCAGKTEATWDHVARTVEKELERTQTTEAGPSDLPLDDLPGTVPGTQIRYEAWSVLVESLVTESDVEQRLLNPLRNRLTSLSL